MTIYQTIKPAQILMGKLSCGCDLLEELTAVCAAEGIRLGRIEAIGAVRKAKIGFYDQKQRVYQFLSLDRPMEITKLTGNISLKDGSVFVHAHVTLSDESGRAWGGHLAPGSEVFACEFLIESFHGPDFNRGFDEETGLALWSI